MIVPNAGVGELKRVESMGVWKYEGETLQYFHTFISIPGNVNRISAE